MCIPWWISGMMDPGDGVRDPLTDRFLIINITE